MTQHKTPWLVAARSKGNTFKVRSHYKSSHHHFKIKKFNPTLLPNPQEYYLRIFSNIKTKIEWVSVKCCFHEDQHPSLRINLITGAFRCFGCGKKGRDILAFHQQLHQLTFIEAVSFFGAWDE